MVCFNNSCTILKPIPFSVRFWHRPQNLAYISATWKTHSRHCFLKKSGVAVAEVPQSHFSRWSAVLWLVDLRFGPCRPKEIAQKTFFWSLMPRPPTRKLLSHAWTEKAEWVVFQLAWNAGLYGRNTKKQWVTLNCQSYSGGAACSLGLVFTLQSPCTFRCEGDCGRLWMASVTPSELLTMHLPVRISERDWSLNVAC